MHKRADYFSFFFPRARRYNPIECIVGIDEQSASRTGEGGTGEIKESALRPKPRAQGTNSSECCHVCDLAFSTNKKCKGGRTKSNRAVKCEKKGLTLPSVEVEVLLHSFCFCGCDRLNVVVGEQESFLSETGLIRGPLESFRNI